MLKSILDSTKQVLGIEPDYTAFDQDVIMAINSAFSTLNQLGVGPEEGFFISDKTTEWDEFIGDDIRLNAVRTYVCLRVRLIFDPPATSFAIQAIEKQIEELAWRINVHREYSRSPLDPDAVILDGGGA